MTLVQTEPKSIKIGTTEIKRVTMRPNGTEKQIRPAGWTPGANTIAYYPLENNSNEASGKVVTTTDNAVNYSTIGGVKCVNTTSSNGYIGVSTSIFDGSSAWTEQTMSFWMYLNVLPGGTSNYAFEFEKQGAYSIYFLARSNNVYRYEGVSAGSTIDVNIPSTDIGKWNYFTLVNSSSGKYMYKNGVLIGSGTGSSRPRGSRPNSYQQNMVILNSRAPGYNEQLRGGLRELIFEKKCWTAQEVSDYYNQAKGNYGL